MRKIELGPTDFDMFDKDLCQDEFDFYQKHKDTFRRMWIEQGRTFWVKFILSFKSYSIEFGALKEFDGKDPKYAGFVEQCFIFMNQQFADGKFSQAKNLIMDIVVLCQNEAMIGNIDNKKKAMNPFYRNETRETFRKLFGEPGDQSSVLKVFMFYPIYKKFGGAVCVCLRRWLRAEEWPDTEDLSYYTPRKGNPSDSGELSDIEYTTCEHISAETLESSKQDPVFMAYLAEKTQHGSSYPMFVVDWPKSKDPRFNDPNNPLFEPDVSAMSDWKADLDYSKYVEFYEYVAENYTNGSINAHNTAKRIKTTNTPTNPQPNGEPKSKKKKKKSKPKKDSEPAAQPIQAAQLLPLHFDKPPEEMTEDELLAWAKKVPIPSVKGEEIVIKDRKIVACGCDDCRKGRRPPCGCPKCVAAAAENTAKVNKTPKAPKPDEGQQKRSCNCGKYPFNKVPIDPSEASDKASQAAKKGPVDGFSFGPALTSKEACFKKIDEAMKNPDCLDVMQCINMGIEEDMDITLTGNENGSKELILTYLDEKSKKRFMKKVICAPKPGFIEDKNDNEWEPVNYRIKEVEDTRMHVTHADIIKAVQEYHEKNGEEPLDKADVKNITIVRKQESGRTQVEAFVPLDGGKTREMIPLKTVEPGALKRMYDSVVYAMTEMQKEFGNHGPIILQTNSRREKQIVRMRKKHEETMKKKGMFQPFPMVNGGTAHPANDDEAVLVVLEELPQMTDVEKECFLKHLKDTSFWDAEDTKPNELTLKDVILSAASPGSGGEPQPKVASPKRSIGNGVCGAIHPSVVNHINPKPKGATSPSKVTAVKQCCHKNTIPIADLDPDTREALLENHRRRVEDNERRNKRASPEKKKIVVEKKGTIQKKTTIQVPPGSKVSINSGDQGGKHTVNVSINGSKGGSVKIQTSTKQGPAKKETPVDANRDTKKEVNLHTSIAQGLKELKGTNKSDDKSESATPEVTTKKTFHRSNESIKDYDFGLDQNALLNMEKLKPLLDTVERSEKQGADAVKMQDMPLLKSVLDAHEESPLNRDGVRKDVIRILREFFIKGPEDISLEEVLDKDMDASPDEEKGKIEAKLKKDLVQIAQLYQAFEEKLQLDRPDESDLDAVAESENDRKDLAQMFEEVKELELQKEELAKKEELTVAELSETGDQKKLPRRYEYNQDEVNGLLDKCETEGSMLTLLDIGKRLMRCIIEEDQPQGKLDEGTDTQPKQRKGRETTDEDSNDSQILCKCDPPSHMSPQVEGYVPGNSKPEKCSICSRMKPPRNSNTDDSKHGEMTHIPGNVPFTNNPYKKEIRKKFIDDELNDVNNFEWSDESKTVVDPLKGRAEEHSYSKRARSTEETSASAKASLKPNEKTEVTKSSGKTLRRCARCDTEEPKPKAYKKCQKCKQEKVVQPRYYCGKQCQMDDWVSRHRDEHLQNTLQTLN